MGTDNQGKPAPGQTVAPTGAQTQAAQPVGPAAQAQQPPAQPQQTRPAPPSTAAQPAPSAEADEAEEADDGSSITWTASEFIAHDKSSSWYGALALSAVLLAGLVYFIARDFVSVAVVLAAALTFGIYASHKPRQTEYRLDSSGMNVGQKRFGYDAFRSFSVLEEGAIPSIVFMPLKRFAVPTTIYYPPEQGDRIVGVLSDRLPMEQRGHDAVDRLMHRIRY